MILKIAGTRYPIKDRDKTDWWLYDDIARVHWYKRIPYSISSQQGPGHLSQVPISKDSEENDSVVQELELLSKYHTQISVLFDGETIYPDLQLIDGYMIETENEDIYGYCVYVIAHMRNGDEKTFAFDGKGYLMNDEGKTIERF